MSDIQDWFVVVNKMNLENRAYFAGSKQDVKNWLGDVSPRNYQKYSVYDEANDSYCTVQEFLETAETSPFVSKFYTMNPETEDLLARSTALADGMRVLIADPDQRIRISDDMPDWELDRALVRNRWCTVTEVEFIPRTKHNDPAIVFVAVYEDDTKRLRRCHVTEAWFVKIDSVTASMEKATERYRNIQKHVSNVVQTALNKYNAVPPQTIEEVNKMQRDIEETVHRILGEI